MSKLIHQSKGEVFGEVDCCWVCEIPYSMVNRDFRIVQVYGETSLMYFIARTLKVNMQWVEASIGYGWQGGLDGAKNHRIGELMIFGAITKWQVVVGTTVTCSATSKLEGNLELGYAYICKHSASLVAMGCMLLMWHGT